MFHKKHIILSLLLALIPLWVFSKTPKMHIVIFADTNDPKIGQSVATDVRLIRNMVGEIDKILANNDVSTDFKEFSGSNCSYNQLQSFLNGLSCKDDIVFFLYNGHGARSHKDDSTSKFPRMCLASNNLAEWMKISDLNNQLRAKQPRLMVVFTDCCNSYFDRKGKENGIIRDKMPSLEGNGIKELFLNNQGEVCITAASPGEYGWCNIYGSYLTLNIINELQNIDKKGSAATWQELLKNTSDQTFYQTSQLYNNHSISNTQRPVYDLNVKSIKVDNNSNNDDDNITDIEDNQDTDSVDNNVVNDNNDDDFNDVNNDDSFSDDNTEVDEYGNPVVNAAHGLGRAFSHSIIIFIIGLIFILVPKKLNLDGLISTILTVIGVFIILKALYDFFTML